MKKATTIREVLTAALWMYEEGGLKWHKDFFFANKDGENIGYAARENPNSVCSACAEGSIELVVADASIRSTTAIYLQQRLGIPLAQWNDQYAQSKSDVIQLFRNARDRLSA